MALSLAETQNINLNDTDKLSQKGSDLLTRISDLGNAKADSILDTVRRNPVTSLVGIFTIGMIAAALLSRRAS